MPLAWTYMRVTRRRVLIISVITAPFLVAAIGIWVFFQCQRIVEEAYAVWQTADLIVVHLEKNCGTWPSGWDDLRSLVADNEGPYSSERDGAEEVGFRPPSNIDRLAELVDVDWGADVAELSRAPFPKSGHPFRVIWLRSGRGTHYEGCEPNCLIKAYLDKRYRVERP